MLLGKHSFATVALATSILVTTPVIAPVDPGSGGGGSSGYVRQYRPQRQIVTTSVDFDSAVAEIGTGWVRVSVGRSVDVRVVTTVEIRTGSVNVDVKRVRSSTVEIAAAKATATGNPVAVNVEQRNELRHGTVAVKTGTVTTSIHRAVRADGQNLLSKRGKAVIAVRRAVDVGGVSASVRANEILVSVDRSISVFQRGVFARASAVSVKTAFDLVISPVALAFRGSEVYLAESGRIQPMVSQRRDLQRRLNARDRGFPSQNDMTEIARLIRQTGTVLAEFINPDDGDL